MAAQPAVVLACALLLVSGCSLAGRSLGGYVDDSLVRGAVKRQLSGDHASHLGDVKVDTFGGTVYLSGAVDTPQQKSDAEIVAWKTKGVQQVVNDLVIRSAPAVSALPAMKVQHELTQRLPGVARVESGRGGGPDLAYDQAGRLVASVYTIAWRDLINAGLETLRSTGRPVDHVSTYALPDRPDQPGPFYAIVLWHVSEPDAAALR